ncbi:MAG: MFS transporter [Erysipelotrichaceae bacterium]|nr:MFS transporter [Erysipelotrichaceae bacterium]
MEKTFNRDHILIQIFYYVTVSSMLGFGTYTMLSRGYSASGIGVLIAVADLLGIAMNFFVSAYLDRSDKINVFQMAMLLACAGLFAYIINCFCVEPSFVLSAAYVLSFSFHVSLSPLLDSVNTAFIKNGYEIHFGIGRSFGSFSYGIACLLFGLISKHMDYYVILLLQICFQSLLILVLFITNRDFRSVSTIRENHENIEKINCSSFLKDHPAFIFTCLGYAGLMSCFSLLMESFLLPIITSVGGTVFDSGLIQGIKAFLEVPFIFCFHLIEKNLSLKTIFLISGMSFIAKNIIMYSMNSVLPLYLSQILQCSSFALILPAFVSYINRNMKSNESARAYALQAIIMTTINMIMNSLGGYIVDLYGVKSLCLIAVIISVISTAVLMLSLENSKTDGSYQE